MALTPSNWYLVASDREGRRCRRAGGAGSAVRSPPCVSDEYGEQDQRTEPEQRHGDGGDDPGPAESAEPCFVGENVGVEQGLPPCGADHDGPDAGHRKPDRHQGEGGPEQAVQRAARVGAVSYTHLRAHETDSYL